MNHYDIVEIFKQYFDIRIAQNHETLRDIYKLRYQVFCKEFHFENEEDCPNQQESDPFDQHAIQAYLYHHPSQTIAGCLRVILPSKSGLRLPFEQFCSPEFLPNDTDYAEVSRLTISNEFRRRQWDGCIPSGVTNQLSQMGKISRNFPLPAISMIFSGAALSRLSLFEYVYAMMEPRLVYAMSSYGLYFEQIGKIAEYHGERAPYRICPFDIWQTVIPELKPLLNFIYFKLSQSIHKPIESESRKVG